TVEARDDAADKFRRARIDRNRVALGGIANRLHSRVKKHPKNVATVVRRAADQEVVGNVAPALLQPFNVGFEAARGSDQRARADASHLVAAPRLGRYEAPAVHLKAAEL